MLAHYRGGGDYERDVVHREAPAYGVDFVSDAFQQIGQLALRNGAPLVKQRVQPVWSEYSIRPLNRCS